MLLTSTRQLFQDYLEALVLREDFARFLTDDVVWTTVETGEQITGRQAVADHIAMLHTMVFDARPEVRVSGATDSHAFLEADFVGIHIGALGDVAPTGARVRVPYCVVYDLTEEGISSLRFYMPSAVLMAQVLGG
jgi:ketosteroid isomerase-like protein